MTDGRLTRVLVEAQRLEQETRKALTTDNLADRDDAVIALRHVTAFRKTVERWIARRAVAAQIRGSRPSMAQT